MTKLPTVNLPAVNLSNMFYHYSTSDGECGTFRAAREMMDLFDLSGHVTADALVQDFLDRVMAE